MLPRALLLLCALSACPSSAQKAAPVDAGVDARPPPPTIIELRLRTSGWDVDTIERRALVPLETALRRIPGLMRTEGTAVAGAGFMTLTFEPKVTPADARRWVWDVAHGGMPPEVDVDASPAAQEELRFALRSETLPLVAVREIAERIVLPRLSRTTGVTEARACGGARRQVTLEIDADRLAGIGMSLRDLTAALARTAPYADVEEIRGAVAAVRNGAPVRINDVARVEDGAAPPDCWVAAADGVPRVEGIVTAADAAALAAAGAALDAVRAEMPAGVAMERARPTLRLTVRTVAGATDPAIAHALAALREAAPTAVAWRDLRGPSPDELELRVPAASLDAVSRALAMTTSMLGPVRTPGDEIQIAVAGSDLELLAAAGEAVRAAVAAVPGVAAVGTVGASRDAPRVDVKPDPEMLARVGLVAADFDAYVRAAMHGVPVARVRDGAEDIPVVVRFPREAADFQAFGRILVGRAGSAVPIGSLARITAEAAPGKILHRDGERIALVWIRPDPDADRRSLRIATWGAASKVTLPAGARLLGP
jgi:Cu/Ag efflux pump CusA